MTGLTPILLFDYSPVTINSYPSKSSVASTLLRRIFLGLANVHVLHPEKTNLVLKLYEKKFDFADAMHLVANNHNATFLTFDKTFIQRVKDLRRALPATQI